MYVYINTKLFHNITVFADLGAQIQKFTRPALPQLCHSKFKKIFSSCHDTLHETQIAGSRDWIHTCKTTTCVKVQPHTPFGYERAQLYGSAPSELTWHRSEPQNSMDVYTDTIMNHKRRSFTNIWQQGKRFWEWVSAVRRTNKVSFGLWFWLRWDSLVNQKELLRMSQKHSNMKLFHSAQYTNYYLPNLIQIMDFPTERQCYVTTDYSTLFPKKQASGFVL